MLTKRNKFLCWPATQRCAEEVEEISTKEATIEEDADAQQQPEGYSAAEAAQAPVQQSGSTRMQQQQGDSTAQHEHAAESHAAAARPGTGEQIANFAQQIKAAASSAVQKMHSISAHATMWWKRRRRNIADSANRNAVTAGNEGDQQAENVAAAAACTEQPEASSTTTAAGTRAARTHSEEPDAAASDAFKAYCTQCDPRALGSSCLNPTRGGGSMTLEKLWARSFHLDDCGPTRLGNYKLFHSSKYGDYLRLARCFR